MPTILNRDDAPSHLFSISELDFSGDLFTERVMGPWFRLGASTIKSTRDGRGVEEDIMRQSLLLAPGAFAAVFDKLGSIGNVLHGLGKPERCFHNNNETREYTYFPFHQFEFPFTSVCGEPLVFIHSDTSGTRLYIAPDILLLFELEEQSAGSGIWWDPRRGVEVLVRRVIAEDHLEAIDIRTDYLLKYLQNRQRSLLVGHYRHLHLINPSRIAIDEFVTGELTLGSVEQQAKALLQNWGLRRDLSAGSPLLQRRLHLWSEIKPPAIDADDPWTDQPSFDPYAFTLPTRAGPVAPARWKRLRKRDERVFEGGTCDFMDRIFFRQEVLIKYEGTAGFSIKDDGSVSCHDYWGLVRSTSRLGNELLSTAIGDFAEGVPFEEWPHWKQYAVDPPSQETAQALAQEPRLADAVNSLVHALNRLNTSFIGMASVLGAAITDPLWRGSLDSLAGRQLKWVYPAAADDEEFLKRSTLASTLFLDGLSSPPMRAFLSGLDNNLHQNVQRSVQSLGSRNLLQRITLVAQIIDKLQPDLKELPSLIQQAEGKNKNIEPDLQTELDTIYKCVRDDFGPLAFLYDLRIHGGLAHPPNKAEAAMAAAKLGLPKESWHRVDYIRLLTLLANSFDRISVHFELAARRSWAVSS
jgi:hypothetical protein